MLCKMARNKTNTRIKNLLVVCLGWAFLAGDRKKTVNFNSIYETTPSAHVRLFSEFEHIIERRKRKKNFLFPH